MVDCHTPLSMVFDSPSLVRPSTSQGIPAMGLRSQIAPSPVGHTWASGSVFLHLPPMPQQAEIALAPNKSEWQTPETDEERFNAILEVQRLPMDGLMKKKPISNNRRRKTMQFY
jgi:hypothetical protein